MNPLHEIASDYENRVDSRTHMFVSATFYTDRGSQAVRVRNMSTDGALIEGFELPLTGTQFTLKRRCLTVTGEVVWHTKRKAGLKFASSVVVTDWLANVDAPRQAEVDAIVADVKARRDRAPAGTSVDRINPANALIRKEICQLTMLMREIADKLVRDTYVLSRHPEVMKLDASLQRAEALVTSMR